MKPGIKTSEFWMTLIGVALGAFVSYSGGSDMVAVALIGAGPAYGIGRSIVKRAAA